MVPFDIDEARKQERRIIGAFDQCLHASRDVSREIIDEPFLQVHDQKWVSHRFAYLPFHPIRACLTINLSQVMCLCAPIDVPRPLRDTAVIMNEGGQLEPVRR